jgi:hypothetical protein
LLVLVGCSAISIFNADDRPNLLFVVADDQAEWAMGCSGHKDAKTPNMDRMAREGVRLTNCFTPTPVCSPSRVAILTSRYKTPGQFEPARRPNRIQTSGSIDSSQKMSKINCRRQVLVSEIQASQAETARKLMNRKW